MAKSKAKKPRSAEDRRRAIARSYEWREFRRLFLYSQVLLAQKLPCSRRTVVDIESAKTLHPRAELLRKFKALKLKHERAEAQERLAKIERGTSTAAAIDRMYRERWSA